MTSATTPARELTEWFPADVKPVHIGYYEVKRGGGICPSFGIHQLRWTGSEWQYACDLGFSHKGGFARMDSASGDKWRGLRSPA